MPVMHMPAGRRERFQSGGAIQPVNLPAAALTLIVAQDPVDAANSLAFVVSSFDVTHLKETELQLRGMELAQRRCGKAAAWRTAPRCAGLIGVDLCSYLGKKQV